MKAKWLVLSNRLIPCRDGEREIEHERWASKAWVLFYRPGFSISSPSVSIRPMTQLGYNQMRWQAVYPSWNEPIGRYLGPRHTSQGEFLYKSWTTFYEGTFWVFSEFPRDEMNYCSCSHDGFQVRKCEMFWGFVQNYMKGFPKRTGQFW